MRLLKYKFNYLIITYLTLLVQLRKAARPFYPTDVYSFEGQIGPKFFFLTSMWQDFYSVRGPLVHHLRMNEVSFICTKSSLWIQQYDFIDKKERK